MSKIVTSPAHEVAYLEICALLQRNADQMTAVEVLAVAANLVGKLIAMQDRSTMTVPEALAIVTANMELGNEQATRQMGLPAAGHA
jgi:hypothetical protein